MPTDGDEPPDNSEDSHTLFLKRLAATHNSWLPENYDDAMRAIGYLIEMVERDWLREPSPGRADHHAGRPKIVNLVATLVGGP
jgi:hypothetical protein